jgi:hypothetical protein
MKNQQKYISKVTPFSYVGFERSLPVRLVMEFSAAEITIFRG